jgi:hypothetical protein
MALGALALLVPYPPADEAGPAPSSDAAAAGPVAPEVAPEVVAALRSQALGLARRLAAFEAAEACRAAGAVAGAVTGPAFATSSSPSASLPLAWSPNAHALAWAASKLDLEALGFRMPVVTAAGAASASAPAPTALQPRPPPKWAQGGLGGQGLDPSAVAAVGLSEAVVVAGSPLVAVASRGGGPRARMSPPAPVAAAAASLSPARRSTGQAQAAEAAKASGLPFQVRPALAAGLITLDALRAEVPFVQETITTRKVMARARGPFGPRPSRSLSPSHPHPPHSGRLVHEPFETKTAPLTIHAPR